MRLLIDSTAWIAHFAQEQNAEKFGIHIAKLDKQPGIAPSIVVYEVYKKLSNQLGEEKALECVAYILSCNQEIPLDGDLALVAADASRKERLGMADAIIAATASVYKATIVTQDEDLGQATWHSMDQKVNLWNRIHMSRLLQPHPALRFVPHH